MLGYAYPSWPILPARMVQSAVGMTHGSTMDMVGTIFLIPLIVLLLAAIPAWPYSRGWGFGPSAVVGILLVVMIIMLLLLG